MDSIEIMLDDSVAPDNNYNIRNGLAMAVQVLMVARFAHLHVAAAFETQKPFPDRISRHGDLPMALSMYFTLC